MIAYIHMSFTQAVIKGKEKQFSEGEPTKIWKDWKTSLKGKVSSG